MVTISAVLEHYGADVSRLRETGWQAIRCPFHADRVKSGSASVELNAYVCHACDMRGDAIGIIRRAENLDYRSAIERARRLFGESNSELRAPVEKANAGKRGRWRDRLFA